MREWVDPVIRPDAVERLLYLRDHLLDQAMFGHEWSAYLHVHSPFPPRPLRVHGVAHAAATPDVGLSVHS